MNVAACLLCAGPGHRETFPFGTNWNGRHFHYLRCERCGASFVDPVPSAETFVQMYDRSNYHDLYYQIVEDDPVSTTLPAVRRHLKPEGRVLDFGCGNGSFLVEARSAGFECDGVELTESARVFAAENSGREIFALEDLMGTGRKYDVIHLGDVLEHVPDPSETLRGLESLLNPAGIFFIEGPLEDNRSPVYYASRLFGWFKKVRGKPIYGSFPPLHLFRATARAQRAFFADVMGYCVIRYSVYESGWPYFNRGDRLTRPQSAGHLLKMLIGLAALGAGKLPGIGNRFFAIVSPRKSS